MTSLDGSTINNETLAHLIIINQMVTTTGCTYDQAKKFLILTEWRLDAARNLFLDERPMPIPSCPLSEYMTPANTPATPPNFPETLLSLNKLSTSTGSNDNLTSLTTTTVATTTTTTTSSSTNPSTSTSTSTPPLSSSPMMTMMMMDGVA